MCEVVRRHADKFRIVSMVANTSSALFLEQVREFRPKFAALVSEEQGKRIANQIQDGVTFAYGKEAAVSAVAYGDTAFIAATGFAGLAYSLKAIECKKEIALANKETLVCGGNLVMQKSKGAGVRILPVDSEHSALWQALSFRLDAPFKRLLITASGGPFYGKSRAFLSKVTPKDALKHPTWQMGAKITIDSATLLNKGFEVIEAKWLYGCPLEKIHTLVQPTSIVHSLVEFEDNSILAQMSYPTMEIPIQLALTYPNRYACQLPQMDFERLGKIEFLPLCREEYPCFDLALKSAGLGDNYPCALNAAGEIAVRAFLEERIGFLQIAETIQEVLSKTERMPADSYGALCQTDERARALALESVLKR